MDWKMKLVLGLAVAMLSLGCATGQKLTFKTLQKADIKDNKGGSHGYVVVAGRFRGTEPKYKYAFMLAYETLDTPDAPPSNPTPVENPDPNMLYIPSTFFAYLVGHWGQVHNDIITTAAESTTFAVVPVSRTSLIVVHPCHTRGEVVRVKASNAQSPCQDLKSLTAEGFIRVTIDASGLVTAVSDQMPIASMTPSEKEKWDLVDQLRQLEDIDLPCGNQVVD